MKSLVQQRAGGSMDQERFVSVNAAKRLATCGRRTLEAAIASGALIALDAGPGHRGRALRYRLRPSDVLDWVQRGLPLYPSNPWGGA